MSNIPVSIQMYTLRDLAKDDFLGLFKKVADIGYKGVELAGTNGLSAKDLKKHLDGLGLKVSGTHVMLEELEKGVAPVADFYNELGCEFISVPWLMEERRKDAAGWAKFGRDLDAAGAQLKKRGIQLCYHNHDFEFVKIDGRYGLDLIYANSSPENVKLELDCFWVQAGGEQPAAYMKTHPGRIPLLHLKDMQPGGGKKFAPVGAGIVDFKAIFAAAPAAGVKWYIVEQDSTYDVPPLDAVRTSFDNLRKWGVA